MAQRDPDYTFDQLRVLEAIEAAGTFAGAARALNRVPSAISYAVRTLEQAVARDRYSPWARYSAASST